LALTPVGLGARSDRGFELGRGHLETLFLSGGDNHWLGASGSIMEQFIATKATKAKNGDITVNLYISNSFTTTDPNQYKLR
jgi:hypothetical protein